MAHWAVTIPADRWTTERLFHHDSVAVNGPAPAGGPAPAHGDEVLVLAGDTPALVATGVVKDVADGPHGRAVLVAYVRRAFDAPAPWDGARPQAPLAALTPEAYRRAAGRLGGDPDVTGWLVSVALPIEAPTPAEAVRGFWSYVTELGPAELPAYVSPSGDELAMQAFVLGAQANQDPEEDDED